MRYHAWPVAAWLATFSWWTPAAAQDTGSPASFTRAPGAPQITATVSFTSDRTRTLLRDLLDRREVREGRDGVAILRVSPKDATMWTALAERRSPPERGRRTFALGWAPPAATQQLQPGKERTFVLWWPDESPPAYIEREQGGSERRVELADREGYVVVLRATDDASQAAVEVEITRRTLVGADYDEAAGAFISRPALMKAICSTTVSLAPDMATVVQWEAPEEVEDEHSYYADRGRGSMPGVAVVLAQEGPDAVPPAPEYGPAPAPPRVEPTEDEKIAVDLKFVDVRLGSPEWQEMAERLSGAGSGRAVSAALSEYVAQGQASVTAAPVLVAADGARAAIRFACLDALPLANTAYGSPVGGGEAGGFREASLPVPLEYQVAVTPRLLPDGRISMVLECRLDQVLERVVHDTSDATSVVGDHLANIDLTVPQGNTGVVRGLVSMRQQAGGNGETLRQPVETLILATPTVQAQPGMWLAQATAPVGANKIMLERPGVRGAYEQSVRAGYPDQIADVVSAAKAAFDGLFPELAKPTIHLEVNEASTWYEHTVTNRRDIIYVDVGSKGLGEYFRADADALQVLCEAVAEIHNPRRVPGFERYIAHCYLAPAAVAEIGPEPLPGTRPLPNGDAVARLGVIADPLFAVAHLDFAAASALAAVERELGFEGLKEVLHAGMEATGDPFAAVREAAIARNPALGDEFALYDQATTLTAEEDGSYLVASFEQGESITAGAAPLAVADETSAHLTTGLEMSTVDTWATHGEQALALRAEDPQTWMSLHLVDPDWKLKDWTRFGRLELDLMLEAAEPQAVYVTIADHVGQGHGLIDILRAERMPPGQPVHVSYDLTPPSTKGRRAPWGSYFDGQVRLQEIADLQIQVARATGPFTLCVDNIRLWPREAGARPAAAPGTLMAGGAAVPVAVPASGTARVAAAPWERPDVLGLAAGQQARTINRPGVTLRYGEDGNREDAVAVDEAFCAAIADVVAAARAALEATFPLLGTRDVNVYVLSRKGWYISTTTNRRDSIYIQPGATGIGEAFRADAGPVAILCQSVAELYTGARIRGLDRYLTHRYLVPAVEDQLGPDRVPNRSPSKVARDGLPMLERITDEAYASVHPDFAAVAAWTEIEAKLGLDGLTELLGAVIDAPDPFAALRAAAVARDEGLDDAFWLCDAADELELEEDGTCLVASFEADEPFVLADRHPLGDLVSPTVVRPDFRLETSQSNEWATDGELSLKFQGDGQAWETFGLWQADWRFGDLRRFSKIELDLMLEAQKPTTMRVRLHDDVWHGHGYVHIFSGPVTPGEPVHVDYALDDIARDATMVLEAAYYDGHFRTSEATNLEVMFVDPEGPVTVYVDNIRFTPRAPGEPAMAPGAAAGPPPQALGPGVAGRYAPGVDGAFVQAASSVVAAAKQAIEKTLPDRRTEQILLVINEGRPWHENVVTDRDHTIYIRVGEHGIGEAMREDAGPTALLCEAVADLYNVWRLPGLNRYLSHRYLVPAVVEARAGELIPSPWPSPLGEDGIGMLDVIAKDEYTFVHPDLAAVAALMATDERLGLDGLGALLHAIPPQTDDPFAAFREAAIEADPELAGAFHAYDEATRLEPDETGTCLITSFEPDEAVEVIETHPFRLRTILEALVMGISPTVEWSFSDEWATDGSRSLKLQADEDDPWASIIIRDPDWKFRDLRRFSEFEFDVMAEAPEPQRIFACINDHVSDGHGQLNILSGVLPPGEWRHVAYELTPENLQGQRDMDAEYFSGQLRAGSAARIYISVNRPQQPITLYLDNLRLRPREAAEAPPAPAATAAPPPVEVTTAEPPTKAADLVTSALAEKQAGRLEQSRTLLEQAIELEPDNTEAHWVLAWVSIDLGDREGAAREFRRVVELAPGSERATEAEKALGRLEQ